MPTITETKVNFLNYNNTIITFTGDKDVATIQAALSGSFAWLANARVTETIEDTVKIITFAESLGSKN